MVDAFVQAVYAAGMAGKVPYLVGSPGIGKTAVVKSLAKVLQAKLYLVYLARTAGYEIHGIPTIGRSPIKVGDSEVVVVEQAPPRYAIEAGQQEKAVIFFDELNQLSPPDMGQVMTIFSERTIGPVFLPRSKVIMVAAGNPPEVSAGGWKLPPPVRRRLVVLPMTPDARAWAEPDNFPSNWGFPLEDIAVFGEENKLTEEERLRKRTIIAAWIRSDPSLFNQPDPVKMSEGFVCPATCEDAADLLAAVDRFVDEKNRPEVRVALLSGVLGEAGCCSFINFMENLKTPSAEEVLSNPAILEKWPDAIEPSRLYYLLMAVTEEVRFSVQRARSKNTEELWQQARNKWYAALEAVGLLQKMGAPVDILVLCVANIVSPDNTPKKVDLSKLRVVDEFGPLIAAHKAASATWVRLGSS